MSEQDQAAAQPARRLVTAETRPALAKHVRLRFDETRKTWVLLAPERMMTPSETAVSVLQLCDGQRTVNDIADKLATEYDAPKADILADILPVLQEMADKRYLAS